MPANNTRLIPAPTGQPAGGGEATGRIGEAWPVTFAPGHSAATSSLFPGLTSDQRALADRMTGGSVNEAVGGVLGRAFELENTENRRHDESLAFMRGEWEKQQVPSMSERDINRRYSRDMDRISGGHMRDLSALRTAFGGAGQFGGGTMAGLGAQLELGRLGQVSSTRRDLMIEKANSDARDRVQQWQAGLGLTELMNESPSMIGLDTMGSVADIRLGQELGERQVEAAREAANAMRDSAESQAEATIWGSVIGGVLGLL